MKRAFDIVAALGGMILFAPLLGALAVSIVLTSGRPAVFKQARVGKGGGLFLIRKFRTMTVLSEAKSGTFEPGNQSRVTPFGRILRKYKLDELPQLWNVLAGDMSLVGPRPEIPKWVGAYPERWARVLVVRPGITDPASIMFRNEESLLASSGDPESEYRETVLPRKLAIYERYVETCSLGRDIRLIVSTVLSLWVDVRRWKC